VINAQWFDNGIVLINMLRSKLPFDKTTYPLYEAFFSSMISLNSMGLPSGIHCAFLSMTNHNVGTFITGKEVAVLWTIFGVLLVLWMLGLVSGYTIGGFIHVLLVIAVVVVLIRIIQGRRPI
jgi:hypothetical protein